MDPAEESVGIRLLLRRDAMGQRGNPAVVVIEGQQIINSGEILTQRL
jgi:hypothetical protein